MDSALLDRWGEGWAVGGQGSAAGASSEAPPFGVSAAANARLCIMQADLATLPVEVLVVPTDASYARTWPHCPPFLNFPAARTLLRRQAAFRMLLAQI